MSRFALDCEMVGSFNKSLLARVSIVNERGGIVMDTFVKPTEEVTDYREFWSGIKKRDLENGENFYTVQNRVRRILEDNILIGHSLHFDLDALDLDHPKEDRRDLARYEPLLRDGQPVALKTLARMYLKRVIQQGEHDSVEDARACMDIYLLFADEWESNYCNTINYDNCSNSQSSDGICTIL